MKRNYLIGFAASAAALALLAFAFYSFYEVYPRTRELPPSREARLNRYLAFDRWLESCGISVRTENPAGLPVISDAEESQIFIQASLFRWTDEAIVYLVRWIEEGGHLFLAVDNIDDRRNGALQFLDEFGIKAKGEYRGYDFEAPDYDSRIFFELSESELSKEKALLLKQSDGLISLAQVKRGNGKLTVSGRPLFLLSRNIDSAPNSRLAYAIFIDGAVENSPERGWLFIRGTEKPRGLFGTLFTEGNFAVLLVSLLVLLVVSFWAVIPVFGLVKHPDEKSAKPLRERFLAEGCFLKRYGALGFYRDAYIKEIMRRLAMKKGIAFNDSVEMEKQVLDIWGRPAEDRDSLILLKALRGEALTHREFPSLVNTFKTILERI